MALTKIPSNLITADAISGSLIADDAIDSEHIVDGAIDAAHMSVNSIDSDSYVDGSIDTAHIGDDQVTADKLANSINTDIAAKLPLAGGTLTGATTINAGNPALVISNSGDAKINLVRSSNNITYSMTTSGSGGHGFYDNVASAYDLYMKGGNVGIGTTSPNANSKLEVDGRVRIGAGSASLPGLTGSGDYDTGVWWGGSDILAVSTAGSERWRWDSDGNVLMQGGSPEFHFGTTNASHANWRIAVQETQNNGFEIASGTTSAGANALSDTYDTRFTIIQTGKVGIGDTNPLDWLEIRTTAGRGGLTISSSNHDYPALSFARNSSATARIYITEPDASHTSAIHLQTSDASGSSPNLVTAMTIDEKQMVKVVKSAAITQVALSSASTVSWNAAAAANAYLATGHNLTIDQPSNAVEGAIISVEIAQGGTAYTVAWHTVFEFAASTAPTMTATANKTDIYTFRYNGSVWQEIGRVQNMAQS